MNTNANSNINSYGAENFGLQQNCNANINVANTNSNINSYGAENFDFQQNCNTNIDEQVYGGGLLGPNYSPPKTIDIRKLAQPDDDKDYPTVAVIVNITSGSSYDPLFSKQPQRVC